MAIRFIGPSEFLEEVWALDGGADLVASAGPFAEVEDTATVRAEGEVLVGDEDDFAACWAKESFGGHGVSDDRF